MNTDRQTEYYISIVHEVRKLSREKDTLASQLIRCHDESVGSKARKYLPWWG